MALKQIVAFALASMAAAESLGEWSIYCGDSVSLVTTYTVLLTYIGLNTSSISSAPMAPS